MKYRIFWKEVRKSIRHSLGRFLAIMGIVALGAGFLAGLSAAQPVMQRTADHYYKETHYMDIKIQSTLGLTEEDIQAVADTQGVLQVMPTYEVDLSACIAGEEGERVVRFTGLPEKMNELVLLSGRMPETEGECLVNAGKAATGGVKLDDELIVLEDGLARESYTVVGLVNSAQYLSMSLGSTSKGSGRLGLIAYLPNEEFEQEVYTAAYVRAEGAEELSAYSPEYGALVDELASRLEQTGEVQAQLRYDDMLEQAREKLAQAQETYQKEKDKTETKLSEADEELSAHEKEVQDGEKQIEAGEKQYETGRAGLDAAWASYERAKDELEEKRANANANLEQSRNQLREKQQLLEDAQKQWSAEGAQLEQAEAALLEAEEELRSAKAELEEQGAALDQARSELDAAYAELQEHKNELPEEVYQEMLADWQEQSNEFFENQKEHAGALRLWHGKKQELEGQRQQWQGAKKVYDEAGAELQKQESALQKAEQELKKTEESVQKQLQEAQAELDQVRSTLLEKEAELQSAQSELSKNEAELRMASLEIADAQRELAKAKKEAEKALRDAYQEIEEGKDQLSEIPKAKWYVLDRDMDESFVSFENDAERMGKIALVFPWMFFVVAALVSLTTMTRMVEEERLLIGTYKALGFSSGRILAKYLVYAALASTVGAVAGMILGFELLPRVICKAYGTMYMLPETQVSFYWDKAVIAGGTALICTLGSTVAACLRCLKEKPAMLMQPSAPKAGKRILLERFTFIWRHLKFTQKVTARNLFRYKKRLFMTVIGIAGCTALLVTGFGLKDSVMDIVENQYHRVYSYDGILGIEDEAKSREVVAGGREMGSYLYVSSKLADVKTQEAVVSAYIYVPEEEETLNEFIAFRTRTGKEPVKFDANSIVITEKLADRLGVEVGGVISLKDQDGMDVALTVGGITENYLYHYVYMPRHIYEDTLGYELHYNQILFKSENSEEARAYFTDAEGISTVQLLEDIIDPVRKMLRSLNLVVLVLIVSAGLLAFIVLYNLTNINITERQRELATIKVLGFRPMELSAYIFRETTMLTLIGCIAGLFAGVAMHRFVVVTAEVDMVMFGRGLHAIHFVWASVATLLFSALVDFAMHFKLKKINMVESLKSVD